MQLVSFVLALLIVMIWGFNFVAIQVGLDEIPPLLLSALRFFFTSIPAIFFMKRPATSFKRIFSYGLFMLALPYSLLFLGIAFGVTPGLASLLMQLQVFFTTLLAACFFGEKFRLWQVFGTVLSFSGIALVAMNLEGSIGLTGFLLIVMGAASWGVANVVSKKIGRVNMVSLVVWGSFISWPPILLLSLLFEGTDSIASSVEHLTWACFGAVLYIAYLATLLAFSLWSWLLHHHFLGIIAPFTLLVPVFGILSSVLLLGEPLQAWKIAAVVLVIAGLCLNLLGPRIFARKMKS